MHRHRIVNFEQDVEGTRVQENVIAVRNLHSAIFAWPALYIFSPLPLYCEPCCILTQLLKIPRTYVACYVSWLGMVDWEGNYTPLKRHQVCNLYKLSWIIRLSTELEFINQYLFIFFYVHKAKAYSYM